MIRRIDVVRLVGTWWLLLGQQLLLAKFGNGFAVDPTRKSPSTTTTKSVTEKPIQTNSDNNDINWVASAFQPEQKSISFPAVVGPRRALIYDTTLRDGTQGESVSASVDDKFKICKRLAAFNVDYIEAGWPGSNPKDATFFERAKHVLSSQERSKLSAFGSTRRKGISVLEDAQVQALLDSEAPTICIVAKSHSWQVTDILRATLDENLAMIHETVEYLVAQGRTVMVDLEHFFDGYDSDPTYATQCCQAAARAGASCLVLCDTNGGAMPWQIQTAIEDLRNKLSNDNSEAVTLGIHCHNDCGMAVANSIMAVQSGVGLVQGTINGVGERTGNADLCSIVPSLALKCETNMSCRNTLKDITSLSRYVDEILNRTPNHAAPYVGSSAFAHKGGLHVAAMKRSSKSYQHAEPADVGNESRVLISELSGRQNILGKVEAIGVHPDIASDRALAVLNRVKQLESKGYTFEGAEASVDLMILHASNEYCPPFRVLDYSANVYGTNLDSASRFLYDEDEQEKMCSLLGPTARATVKVRTIDTSPEGGFNQGGLETGSVAGHGGENAALFVERLEVADGNGPVDALANALMRALVPSHPSLQEIELVDYKVRILDPESATGAATRVMVEFRDLAKEKTWTTVSVDTNVISASLNALIDGFEFALLEYADDVLCEF